MPENNAQFPIEQVTNENLEGLEDGYWIDVLQ
jgi:hypothetical protein